MRSDEQSLGGDTAPSRKRKHDEASLGGCTASAFNQQSPSFCSPAREGLVDSMGIAMFKQFLA